MTGLRHSSDVQPKVPGDEALSMSDPKKPRFPGIDAFNHVTGLIRRRPGAQSTTFVTCRPPASRKMQNNADEREIFYPDRAGRVVDREIVAAARRPGKYSLVAAVVRKMKEDGASAADIETITRALLGDMG